MRSAKYALTKDKLTSEQSRFGTVGVCRGQPTDQPPGVRIPEAHR